MRNEKDLLDTWLSLSVVFAKVTDQLETLLQKQYDLSLKEFYVLHFISRSDNKKLRLQQLQELIGLSQSATSRLVVRMEAKECGVLERMICEDDRRGIYTRITELGEKQYQGALDTVNDALEGELLNRGRIAEFQQIIGQRF